MPIILCVHTAVIKDKTESRKTASAVKQICLLSTLIYVRGKKNHIIQEKKVTFKCTWWSYLQSPVSHFFHWTPKLRYYTGQTDMHGGGTEKENEATLQVNRWLNISEYCPEFLSLSLYLRMKGSCSDIPSFQ